METLEKVTKVRGHGGGKGGSGGGGPSEAPNTLQSRSLARVIDAISEGEIGGLVNGPQSIFLDDTPYQNPDGTYNFKGITFYTRNGLPDQDYIPGFSAVETEWDVGAKIIHAAPITRTITNTNVNAVRVKIQLPNLTFLDQSNGYLGPNSVEFNILLQSNGGGFEKVKGVYDFRSKTGTTSSNTAKGLRVTLQKTVPYPPISGGLGLFTPPGPVNFIFKYRPVGSLTWTQLSEDLQPTRQEVGKPITKVFEVTGLPEDDYEIGVDSLTTIILFEEFIPVPYVISGKTTSKYEQAYRVPLTGSAPWDIRVERVTADPVSAGDGNLIYWSTYTELIDQKMIYPDTALVAMQVDAQQFGDNIPTRGYEIYGIKVKVPSNYDPITRAYTGMWDGTFQIAWTNNPAWVMYDILTNVRYGLGGVLKPEMIDKWRLYEIGQYSDELVPDGFGNMEPRFTFNYVINTRQEALAILQTLASSFRGQIFWQSGTVSFTQDSPTDAVKLITPANTREGKISYSGSSLKSRSSRVLVTWNDPEQGYKPSVEIVEDPDMIERYGINQQEVTHYGCTSKGQANRYGRWILDTQKTSTELAGWGASFDNMDLRPGDVVKIADPVFAGIQFGGRVVDVVNHAIVLDREVEIKHGVEYMLMCTLPDGSLKSSTVITAPGTASTIEVLPHFPRDPLSNSVWVMAGDIVPREFRIVSVREAAKNEFDLTGLFHDPTKYARVEEGLILEVSDYTAIPTGPIGAPTNLSKQEYLYQTLGAAKSAATISWTPSNDPRVILYRVMAQAPGANGFELVGTTRNPSIDLLDTTPGVYAIRIYGVDGLNFSSQPLEATIQLHGLLDPPADVQNFQMQVIAGSAFLSWDKVPDLDLDHYEIRFSQGLVSGGEWGSAQIVVPRVGKDSISVAAPLFFGTYLIRGIDTSGIYSANPAIVFSNVSTLDAYNAIATVTESPTFSGTKTNCHVVSGALQLTDVSTAPQSGLYVFANALDLGQVYTSRLTANIMAQGVDIHDNIDLAPNVDLLDNWDGHAGNSWGIGLEVRKTDDNPSGSPVWSAWLPFVVGDYTGRGFQWRLKLTSAAVNITPSITVLAVTVDMPDRVAGARSVSCPSGGLDVVFSPAFHTTPAIGITGQALASGDYPTITAQSRTGFHIQFFNASNVGITRTFDWLAKGWGFET